MASTAYSQTADLNGDGNYDCQDMNLIAAAYGSSDARYDLDGSGVVDSHDESVLLDRASEALGYHIESSDFDMNGGIDHRDFLIMAANVDSRLGSHPVTGYCNGDLDGDRIISRLESNDVAIDWLHFTNPNFPPRETATVEDLYEIVGEGWVFARTSQFDLVAYPESVAEGFRAIRLTARMHDPTHEFVTVDSVTIEGDLHQVWIPGFGVVYSTPTLDPRIPFVSEWPESFQTWFAYDSHFLVGDHDLATSAGGGAEMYEDNDSSGSAALSQQLSIEGVEPILGIGNTYMRGETGIIALRADGLNELSLARLVTPEDLVGGTGEVLLTIGLQGVDSSHTPLADVGLIESLRVPFAPGITDCDLDGDTDCDIDDLESFVQMSGDVDLWLDLANTVRGDTDLDDDVDAVDLNNLAVNWLQPGEYGWAGGDFDFDGDADSEDLNVIGVNWQFGTTVASPIPEPSAALLLTIGLCFSAAPQIARMMQASGKK